MATIHVFQGKASAQQISVMLEAFKDQRMIKIVVDTKRRILAGGSGMHFDCEQLLLKQGSAQEDLWGANWFPDDQEIEFVSLINARGLVNRSIILQVPELRDAVEEITCQYLGGVMP